MATILPPSVCRTSPPRDRPQGCIPAQRPPHPVPAPRRLMALSGFIAQGGGSFPISGWLWKPSWGVCVLGVGGGGWQVDRLKPPLGESAWAHLPPPYGTRRVNTRQAGCWEASNIWKAPAGTVPVPRSRAPEAVLPSARGRGAGRWKYTDPGEAERSRCVSLPHRPACSAPHRRQSPARPSRLLAPRAGESQGAAGWAAEGVMDRAGKQRWGSERGRGITRPLLPETGSGAQAGPLRRFTSPATNATVCPPRTRH